MRRLLDWLRFHGWRTAYWREDAWAARCPHEMRDWLDETLFCADCGAVLAHSIIGSSNTTTYVTATVTPTEGTP